MLLETRWFHEKNRIFQPKELDEYVSSWKADSFTKKKMDFETKELVRKRRVVKKINSRKKWIDESIYVKMKLHF